MCVCVCVCLVERHERRVWLWLWSCRLPVLWFGLVNACLPLPCRVAHAAGHMAACRGALGRHRPGLARSNRPGTGRGTESAAGSRTEPCRASRPCTSLRPAVEPTDRPTVRAAGTNHSRRSAARGHDGVVGVRSVRDRERVSSTSLVSPTNARFNF